MSDDAIFNEDSEDVILGNVNAKIRNFVVSMTGTTTLKNNSNQSVFVLTQAGNLTHKGNLSTEGNATVSGSLTAGNTTVNGNLITSGNLTVGGTATWANSIVGTTKLFDIPHPQKEDMRLRHGCLEGPELAVYVRGKTSEGIIPLPGYWEDLVDVKTITVHLTPTNMDQNLAVNNVNGLAIQVLGNQRLPYYYYVMAERKDVSKLEVEIDA